jgi:hypothetical protein
MLRLIRHFAALRRLEDQLVYIIHLPQREAARMREEDVLKRCR